MANKKVFSIEINGLTESVKAVDALTEKLNALNAQINKMKKQGIEIPIEVGGEELIKEVKNISAKVKKATKGSLPIGEEKEYIKALKDRQRQLEAVNKELGDTGKNLAEYKQETKELVAQETKARNEAKAYANTLNGLKAELKDLNSIKGNLDLNSEEYAEVSQQILILTTRLKEYEAAQGSFGRNVGNYKNDIKDAAAELNGLGAAADESQEDIERLDAALKDLAQTGTKGLKVEDLEKYGITIEQVRQRIETLTKLRNSSVMGSTEYQEYDKLLDVVKKVDNELKRLQGTVVKADNQLKTQLQRTINGTTYTWETLTSAVGELEDKLYQLAASGQKNTAEFEAIANAAAELKTQLRQVDYEIDSLTESSRGITKMVSYAQGFTAIAQGAQGFGQLFGMNDEDSLKGIQTLQSLQSIAMSLQTVKELSKQGTAFGKMMDNWISKLETFAVASSSVFKKWSKQLTEVKELADFTFEAAEDGFVRIRNVAANGPKGEYTLLDPNEKKELDKLIGSFKLSENEADKFRIALKELQLECNILQKGTKEASDVWAEFGLTLQKIWSVVKQSGRELRDIAFNTLPFLSKIFPKVSEKINASAEGMVKMGTGAKLASVGVKVLNVSLKALAAALAATGVFLLVEALILLVGWMSDGVKWLYTWATGNDKLTNSVDTLEGRLSALNTATENYIRNLERLNAANKLSDIDKAAKQYSALQKAVEETTKQLKEFVKLRGEQKKLEDNFSDDGLTQTWDFKSLEQFRTEYEKLLKAVESGTDVKGKKSGKWYEVGKYDIWNWFTAKDAKSDLGEMQKRVIQDIQDKINNLDLSKGTQELENFFKIMDDEMYKTSIENIENLFPEEEWASVLKQRLESLRDFYDQAIEAGDNFNEVAKQRANTIRDNYNEATKDEQERELQALRNQMKDEIDNAKGDQELILSIRAKYQRLEEDMLKKHNEAKLNEIKQYETDLTNILRQIRDNYLSAENESLAKRLQAINNERNDAIEDARKAADEAAKEGIDITQQTDELIKSINAKYDAEAVREKEGYYKTLLEQYENYRQELIKVQSGLSSDRLDAKSKQIDIEYNISSNSSDGSFNFDDRLNAEKKFNADRLALELDYLNKKKQMDNEYTTFDRDDALLQEEDRYNKAMLALEDFKKSGNATEEEYNALRESEEELHTQKMLQINERYYTQIEQREAEHQNEVKNLISSSLRDQVSAYEIYATQVADIMSEVGTKENAFGIISYKDTKAQLDQALLVVKQGINDIDNEIANLDKQKSEGKISFVDWKAAVDDLKNMRKGLEQEGKGITEMLDTLLGETASQWKGMVDQWVQAISSLLSTLNDTQMQLIENQMAEIDHQLEIQEQAYDRAEEAAEEHKNKMDSIEDELSEARGARRQFLIDSLAAQQQAYLEDLAAQQRAAEEKEKLEKKQKALEKKRKEQEKKSNVQQAIINTYMAVSNALAVQPWFVGLALSAVALGLGLSNVAAIKNTPIYEDGGVIQGPRHSQGGVKVLGGRAEVEGGEYVTNRKSTAANLPLLTYINDQKRELTAEDLMKFFASNTPKVRAKATRMFADGGQLPAVGAEVNRVVQVNDSSNENAVYVVQVTDIINATENLRKVQTLSGLYNA